MVRDEEQMLLPSCHSPPSVVPSISSFFSQSVSKTSDLYPNAEQIYERDKIQERVFPDAFLNSSVSEGRINYKGQNNISIRKEVTLRIAF